MIEERFKANKVTQGVPTGWLVGVLCGLSGSLCDLCVLDFPPTRRKPLRTQRTQRNTPLKITSYRLFAGFKRARSHAFAYFHETYTAW